MPYACLVYEERDQNQGPRPSLAHAPGPAEGIGADARGVRAALPPDPPTVRVESANRVPRTIDPHFEWPTMSDPLTWSPIRLGRWFGTTIKVHISLILFVVIELLMALLATSTEAGLRRFPQTACWLSLLILALLVHEMGHALCAYWLDSDQDDVHLWPLGNLVGPGSSPRSGEHFLVALAGPVTSGALFLGIAAGLNLFVGARCVINPFGNVNEAGAPFDSGAPWIGNQLARPLTPVWMLGWFGYLNYL